MECPWPSSLPRWLWNRWPLTAAARVPGRKRSKPLRGLGIQEWLSFYFKSPMSAPGLYPEHDLFIQLMKLKNTLRHLKGEQLITHLGLEYY